MRLRQYAPLWLGASVAVVVGAFAARFALVERTRSLATVLPQPSVREMPQLKAPRGQARGAVLRLTELLGQAQVSATRFTDPAVKVTLDAHWRRHISPYSKLTGELSRFVQSVSLARHKAVPPTPASETGQDRDAQERLQRDTQTFGLGEGSFDERECLVLPAPARVRYTLEIEPGQRLRFAPAVLGEGSIAFEVSCRAKGATEATVLFSRVEEGPSRRWSDVSVDLSRCVGRSELILSTVAPSKTTAIGLFGAPVVLGPEATALPYNVLLVVVDAMRGDAIAKSHDPERDARIAAAKVPPLDAAFARMPEVAPNIDQLAARGAIWQSAWSAAMWTRPATVAMLSGMRPSRLGLSVMALELIGHERRDFYAAGFPLLPRLLREAGADVTAIVNNMYLSGSVGVGVDLGFQSVIDHRYAAIDTGYITEDVLTYLDTHLDERFFLLVNYASPHSPHTPPKPDLAAIAKAEGLPTHPTVRGYLGEVHKDDRAIGKVLAKLDSLGLREKTLVVITADHGETMSAAHDVTAIEVAQGARSGRFTHLSTMWAEAAQVALVMSLPGRIPEGRLVKTPVQTLDIVPTILELEGLTVPDGLDGRSLVPQFSGNPIAERPIIIEGRGARSIQVDQLRLIVRDRVAQRLQRGTREFEKKVELYDHAEDPGERVDIAMKRPDLVAKLRAELEAQLSLGKRGSQSVASSKLSLAFALGGKQGHVSMRLFSRTAGQVRVESEDVDLSGVAQGGSEIRVAFDAPGDRPTRFAVELTPSDAELGWELLLDGKPWPKERIFGGPLGLRLQGLESGLSTTTPASAIESRAMPHVAAGQELGLFVVREPRNGVAEVEVTAAAALEAEQAMQAWGYARKTPKKKP